MVFKKGCAKVLFVKLSFCLPIARGLMIGNICCILLYHVLLSSYYTQPYDRNKFLFSQTTAGIGLIFYCRGFWATRKQLLLVTMSNWWGKNYICSDTHEYIRCSILTTSSWNWASLCHRSLIVSSGLRCPLDGSKNLALSIHVSDCIPLLFYLNHEEKPAIGVIHCGWKWAKENIVSKCLQSRAEKWYDISRAYVWMWPSICQDNYEFGEEATEIFGDDYCSIAMGTTYLDLRWYVMDQLRDAGILSSHIRYQASCTFDDDRLFSYREDPTTKRRMFWVIMLT
jgi:hypothetical protein